MVPKLPGSMFVSYIFFGIGVASGMISSGFMSKAMKNHQIYTVGMVLLMFVVILRNMT